MKEMVFVAGGIYGALGVLLGAFGAHGLKRYLDPPAQRSFETGVRYQIYHALMLIMLGVIFPFVGYSQNLMGWFLILGVLFFSFSIYGLVLSDARGHKWAFLGPVTPLGGLLLLMGWLLFIVNIVAITS